MQELEAETADLAVKERRMIEEMLDLQEHVEELHENKASHLAVFFCVCAVGYNIAPTG